MTTPHATEPVTDDDRYDLLFDGNGFSVTFYIRSALFDLTTVEGGTERATEKLNRALDLLRALKGTWTADWQPPAPHDAEER